MDVKFCACVLVLSLFSAGIRLTTAIPWAYDYEFGYPSPQRSYPSFSANPYFPAYPSPYYHPGLRTFQEIDELSPGLRTLRKSVLDFFTPFLPIAVYNSLARSKYFDVEPLTPKSDAGEVHYVPASNPTQVITITVLCDNDIEGGTVRKVYTDAEKYFELKTSDGDLWKGDDGAIALPENICGALRAARRRSAIRLGLQPDEGETTRSGADHELIKVTVPYIKKF